MPLLLGIDLGTSFVKASVIDAQTGKCLASAKNSEAESAILSPHPGWAEQCPEQWWVDVKTAILNAHALKKYNPKDIAAIGIAYQMHGLVLVDSDQKVLRNSIIWCDSRAVDVGKQAAEEIGEAKCISHLLNAPGNFTASKLAWVKKHEPNKYEHVHQVMLPGDFIAMKFTGDITTTPSALSEGIFWDFKKGGISKDVLQYFQISKDLFPEIKPVFDIHGCLAQTIAQELSLKPGIPLAYKAGDQLNNALSLNVLKPGEVAATAGTSGVIYAVTDHLHTDKQSRVNSFAHVNHTKEQLSLGVLLCINGCGIMNSWIKKRMAPNFPYASLNAAASKIPVGSEGLRVLPFGNGAERMLENKNIGAQFINVNLTKHSDAHMFRAVQEGIAFAFRYGLDIMRENGIDPGVVRAGNTNLFLSDVFTEAFVNSTELELEIYDHDGSKGAAIGAGIGAGIYHTKEEAFTNLKPTRTISPTTGLYIKYENTYHHWKKQLQKHIN